MVVVAAAIAVATLNARPLCCCEGRRVDCARDRTRPPGPSAGRSDSGPGGARVAPGRGQTGPAATNWGRHRRAGRTRRPNRGCPALPVLSWEDGADN